MSAFKTIITLFSLAMGIVGSLGSSVHAADDNHRFMVTGTVRDNAGNPISGVEIRASSGRFTLLPAGLTITRDDGSYELSCRPGYYGRDSTTGKKVIIPQFLTITAHKRGFYETNLLRQGGLRMAVSRTQLEGISWAKPDKTVFHDIPYTLDFEMAPAARIVGLLSKENGSPMPEHRMCLSGKELPPSTSVFISTETDKHGRFIMNEVPLKPFWFDCNDVKSNTFAYTKPGTYTFELVFNNDSPGTLQSTFESYTPETTIGDAR